MKQLTSYRRIERLGHPASVDARVRAIVTHGIPGAVIGSAVLTVILADHIANALWHALPVVVGIGVLLFSLGLVSLAALDYRANRNFEVSGMTGIAGAAVALFWLAIAFASANPAPPIDNSCTRHGGYLKEMQMNPGATSRYSIVCRDGYTFEP